MLKKITGVSLKFDTLCSVISVRFHKYLGSYLTAVKKILSLLFLKPEVKFLKKWLKNVF